MPVLKIEPNSKEIISEGIITVPRDGASESLIK